MSRGLRIAVGAVGIVLIVLSAVIKWGVAPSLVKIPTGLKKTTTIATGSGEYLNTATFKMTQGQFMATRIVTGDKSSGTGNVAVWDETLCVIDKTNAKPDDLGCVANGQPGYLDDKHTDRVAIDRKSAEAVNDAKYKTAVDGKAEVTHEGVDYTFPIGTKKKTYQLYDAIARKAAPANYEGSEKLDGLTAYKFVSDVPPTLVTIQGIVPATYTSNTTVYVEPTTGVILKGVQHIQYTALTLKALDTTLTFTPDTVKSQADYAKSQISKIHVIRDWIPLAALVLGVLLLLGALLPSRRRPQPEAEPAAVAGGEGVS